MRPARPSRLLPLALAVLVLASAACSSVAPSSDVGSSAVPTSTAALSSSQAAVVSSAPSGAPSPSDAIASASAAPASPTAAPTAKPTPKPTPRPTAAPTGYLCVRLLLNSEVRKATGLSDATLQGNHNGTPQAVGQTYCPYLAQSGQVTVAAAVWTGSSYRDFLKLWDSVATYSQPVTGIGSQAIIDAGDGVGLAIVGKVGVSVQIKGPSGVPAGVDALTACQTLLKLLARRV